MTVEGYENNVASLKDHVNIIDDSKLTVIRLRVLKRETQKLFID